MKKAFLLLGVAPTSLLALVLAQPDMNSPPRPLVFTHVAVIDATGAPAQPDMTVVITAGRLTALGKAGRVRVPAGATVVDASGKFLIPGLWDMHVHLWERSRSFPLLIANGVTGVRVMGGHIDDLPSLQEWRRQVETGALLGPRLVFAGPVVDGPKPVWPGSIAVFNPQEARKAVQDLKQRGVDFIKVYLGLPRECYFALAKEAERLGIPFAGHVPESVTPAEASDAGQRSIEHLDGTMKYSILRMQYEPMDPAAAAALARRFVKNNTWQVPTLVAARAFAFIHDPSTRDDPRLRYIPLPWQRNWDPENDFRVRGQTPEQIDFRKKMVAETMAVAAKLHRAGVRFLAGTDTGGVPYTYPGFSLHDELALLVEAGFTPMEALEAATRDPAEFLGRLNELGTVEQGKVADLVLLEANPLEDIRNTKRIAAVVVRGTYLSRSALDTLLAQAEAAAGER